MVPLVNTVLVFMGFLVFLLRNARAIYFELALAAFASAFMAAILVLSEQYGMLGRIYFPLFYWGLLIFPLFLFSNSRVLCFIWAFLFFVGLFYWAADADILNSGFILQYRVLVLLLLFPFIALLYLLSELLQFNPSMRKALVACTYLSFMSIFLLMDFSAFSPNVDRYLGPGFFSLTTFNVCVLVVAFVAIVIIALQKITVKQKLELISFVVFLLGSLYAPNNLIRLSLLLLVLISLLMFYASIHYRFASDLLAVVVCLHLSLSMSTIIYPHGLFYFHYTTILGLFIAFTGLYFLKIRKCLL